MKDELKLDLDFELGAELGEDEKVEIEGGRTNNYACHSAGHTHSNVCI